MPLWGVLSYWRPPRRTLLQKPRADFASSPIFFLGYWHHQVRCRQEIRDHRSVPLWLHWTAHMQVFNTKASATVCLYLENLKLKTIILPRALGRAHSFISEGGYCNSKGRHQRSTGYRRYHSCTSYRKYQNCKSRGVLFDDIRLWTIKMSPQCNSMVHICIFVLSAKSI